MQRIFIGIQIMEILYLRSNKIKFNKFILCILKLRLQRKDLCQRKKCIFILKIALVYTIHYFIACTSVFGNFCVIKLKSDVLSSHREYQIHFYKQIFSRGKHTIWKFTSRKFINDDIVVVCTSYDSYQLELHHSKRSENSCSQQLFIMLGSDYSPNVQRLAYICQ